MLLKELYKHISHNNLLAVFHVVANELYLLWKFSRLWPYNFPAFEKYISFAGKGAGVCFAVVNFVFIALTAASENEIAVKTNQEEECSKLTFLAPFCNIKHPSSHFFKCQTWLKWTSRSKISRCPINYILVCSKPPKWNGTDATQIFLMPKPEGFFTLVWLPQHLWTHPIPKTQ